MKTKQVTKYICEICNAEYLTEDSAKECESRPICEDKGVKIGDIVLITSGEGTGSKAKVTHRYVLNREWGHYAWKRYWHTVALTADVIGGYGSRMLTFDGYEVIKKDYPQ